MKAWLPLLLALLPACGENPAANALESASAAAKAPASARIPAPREGAAPLPRVKLTLPYRAAGTEPFWTITVREPTAILERPDQAPARFTVSRQDDGRTIRYSGEDFAMTVSEGPCSDGMSNATWSDRVEVALHGERLKGCGGSRQDGDSGPP